MVLLRIVTLLSVSIFVSCCQLGYIARSSYHQAEMLRQRVPIAYALENFELTDLERDRLQLSIRVRQFMSDELGLKTDGLYKRYVHLDRPYVTYVVNAAYKDRLKPHSWSFPIIGSVPYKGYFDKTLAMEEAKRLNAKGYDTHVRGVKAYSTLGWFEDPILSPMLNMKEHHFINMLIHETVHANLYIKSHAKFNERVASFLGQLGTEAFYSQNERIKELKNTLKMEKHDSLLFSQFIDEELQSLRSWYKDNQNNPNLLSKREEQFKEIQQKFNGNVLPQMKSKNYEWFTTATLNNAHLLLLELYMSDFDEFEILANSYQRDFRSVFKALKKLEKVKNPEETLKKMTKKITK